MDNYIDGYELALRRRYAEQMAAYREAIKPLVKMKIEIYGFSIPKIRIFKDGRIEHEFTFTEQQEKNIKLIDEAIIHIQEKIFADHNKPAHCPISFDGTIGIAG